MSILELINIGLVETWVPVVGYEDKYLVSNSGMVFSLWKHKLLKPGISNSGYFYVSLVKHKKDGARSLYVHHLMSEAFLKFKTTRKVVINHRDFNRLNNFLANLEVIPAMENSNRLHLKSTSKYVGVSFCRSANKWRAQITENGKVVYLGVYDIEEDARYAYLSYLKTNSK